MTAIHAAQQKQLGLHGRGRNRDTAYFGPEAEFFIFEDVKIDVSMNRGLYQVDSVEGPYNSARKYDEGNMGHRPGVKGGYFQFRQLTPGRTFALKCFL